MHNTSTDVGHLEEVKGSWSTCVHVGHGEVDRRLPDGGDAHVNHRHVGLLVPQLLDHAGPLAVLVGAVGAVRLQVELELEFYLTKMRQSLGYCHYEWQDGVWTNMSLSQISKCFILDQQTLFTYHEY